ncbi:MULTISPECIES: TetR/AcrR family transcriptional regulator [Ferrimonas]|uniref:TetR/AcrR family transcriptional regulator n=1 Tax=Ferrimonas TaxID=44011 RepID=UPI000422C3C0|nr:MULTISPECIES: TetR/AcrR family transcriptional regulator [Ferrimonas]USD38193.1 TetR/AcrR family transcriptional regulator [Ferrimonas sp. SCSIO 43195]
MANRQGRPVGDSDARQRLIDAARKQFSFAPYEKVSTRQVAEEAGVNAALIRYYFANKWGLFETMMAETVAPISEKVLQAQQSEDFESISVVMRTYNQVMSESPYFPRLVYRLLSMEGSAGQVQQLQKLIHGVFSHGENLMFEELAGKGGLKPGVDPALARLSFASLMVFPFLAPPSMLKVQGIKVDDDFYHRLAEHNIALLQAGLLKQPE